MAPPGVVSTDTGHEVDTEALSTTMVIDMVELGNGCARDCISCGAFPDLDPSRRRVIPISEERLRNNLEREIESSVGGVKCRLYELLSKAITTGVDMEPLDAGIFNQAAELICSLTGGKSKLVAISHGLTCLEKRGENGEVKYEFPEGQTQRLIAMNDLLLREVIPLFVLSMDAAGRKGLPSKTAEQHHQRVCEMEAEGSDFMRVVEAAVRESQQQEGLIEGAEKGEALNARSVRIRRGLMKEVRLKIRDGGDLTDQERIVAGYLEVRNLRRNEVVEVSARGYAETLYRLLPSIIAGKKITVSLQGDSNEDSLAYQGLSRRIQQRTSDLLADEYGVPSAVLHTLFSSTVPPRHYIGKGRAMSMLHVSNGECPVIPDPKFVREMEEENRFKVTRGRLLANGTLLAQLHRPNRTYNDTLGSDDNPWAVVNLTSTRVREASATP